MLRRHVVSFVCADARLGFPPLCYSEPAAKNLSTQPLPEMKQERGFVPCRQDVGVPLVSTLSSIGVGRPLMRQCGQAQGRSLRIGIPFWCLDLGYWKLFRISRFEFRICLCSHFLTLSRIFTIQKNLPSLARFFILDAPGLGVRV